LGNLPALDPLAGFWERTPGHGLKDITKKEGKGKMKWKVPYNIGTSFSHSQS